MAVACFFFFFFFFKKKNFGGLLESLSPLKTIFTVFETALIVEISTKEGLADSSSRHSGLN